MSTVYLKCMEVNTKYAMHVAKFSKRLFIKSCIYNIQDSVFSVSECNNHSIVHVMKSLTRLIIKMFLLPVKMEAWVNTAHLITQP